MVATDSKLPLPKFIPLKVLPKEAVESIRNWLSPPLAFKPLLVLLANMLPVIATEPYASKEAPSPLLLLKVELVMLS